MNAEVRIASGSLYLPAALYAAYFQACDSVALIADDAGLALLPLRSASHGGLLLKQRNAHGDRVIHAAEFLRAHGIDDAEQHTFAAIWDAAAGALRLRAPTISAPVSAR